MAVQSTREPETQSPPTIDPARDLEARMRQRFRPTSPVEIGSLAVVTIRSGLGNASGFFVSENGFLITSRDIVRPGKEWAEKERAALEGMARELDALKRRLSLPRDRFSDPNDYDRGERVLLERTRAYGDARRAWEAKRAEALLQRAFEIELEGGETLTAELTDVSNRYELALLRVTGYRTPHLRPLQSNRLQRGETVYAIGRPAGNQNKVSTGIFSGEHEDLLLTDMPVSPGARGGPLITAQGLVVGVSTSTGPSLPSSAEAEVGVAIPIHVAFREFPDLASHAKESAAYGESGPGFGLSQRR
jgi:serine protease Do